MTGPLTGVVVADLTRALAGPHATMLLGDLGARVIKVEQPGTGDECRQWGPPFAGPPDNQVSTYFLSCNRNKESVTCDMKSAAGRNFLTRLIPHCDVLVENFRSGVLDRAGFGIARLRELNPRLVICSISGFGHDGPERGRPGYDQIVQGEAGLMSVTGPDRDHPVKSGLSVADVLAGLNAAVGVIAALFERQQTGCGSVVRTSLLASVVGAHAYQGTRWTVAGEVPHMTGNQHPSIAPYGAFRCADGLLQSIPSSAVSNCRARRCGSATAPGTRCLQGTPGLAAALRGRVTARTWSTRRRRCSASTTPRCGRGSTRWTPQPVTSRHDASAHDVRGERTIAPAAPRVSDYLASGTSWPLRIASATSTPNR